MENCGLMVWQVSLTMMTAEDAPIQWMTKTGRLITQNSKHICSTSITAEEMPMWTDQNIVGEIGGHFYVGHTWGNTLPPQTVLSEHYQGIINQPKLTFQKWGGESGGKYCGPWCRGQVWNWLKSSNSTSNTQVMHSKSWSHKNEIRVNHTEAT